MRKAIPYVIFILIFAFLRLYVWHHVIQSEEAILEAKAEIESQRNLNTELKLDYNRLRAPERIIRLASQELGMIPFNKQNQGPSYVIETVDQETDYEYCMVDPIRPSGSVVR